MIEKFMCLCVLIVYNRKLFSMYTTFIETQMIQKSLNGQHDSASQAFVPKSNLPVLKYERERKTTGYPKRLSRKITTALTERKSTSSKDTLTSQPRSIRLEKKKPFTARNQLSATSCHSHEKLSSKDEKTLFSSKSALLTSRLLSPPQTFKKRRTKLSQQAACFISPKCKKLYVENLNLLQPEATSDLDISLFNNRVLRYEERMGNEKKKKERDKKQLIENNNKYHLTQLEKEKDVELMDAVDLLREAYLWNCDLHKSEADERNSASIKEKTLKQRIKKVNIPDISFDIDNDGWVSATDLKLANRFDKDGSGTLDEHEKKCGREIMARELWKARRECKLLGIPPMTTARMEDGVNALISLPSNQFTRGYNRQEYLLGIEKLRSSERVTECIDSPFYRTNQMQAALSRQRTSSSCTENNYFEARHRVGILQQEQEEDNTRSNTVVPCTKSCLRTRSQLLELRREEEHRKLVETFGRSDTTFDEGFRCVRPSMHKENDKLLKLFDPGNTTGAKQGNGGARNDDPQYALQQLHQVVSAPLQF